MLAATTCVTRASCMSRSLLSYGMLYACGNSAARDVDGLQDWMQTQRINARCCLVWWCCLNLVSTPGAALCELFVCKETARKGHGLPQIGRVCTCSCVT
jgi:hypothetical protein